MKLEITTEMCINHLRLQNKKMFKESDIKHYNCDGYNILCPNYLPYKGTNCQIPIRKGSICYSYR